MSVSDTALVFVGVPAAIALIVTVLVMARGGRSPQRYRPGRPFNFTPVWFLSAPDQLAEAPGSTALHLEGRSEQAELTKGHVEIKAAPRPGPTGGASDRW